MLLSLLCLLVAPPPQTQAPFIPSWSGLSARYDYQHLKTSDYRETTTTEPDDTKITFTFPGTPGDIVHGLLVEPKSGSNFPCVLLLHGLGGNKESLAQRLGKELLAKGIAYADIDAPGHGERQTPDDKKLIGSVGGAFLVSKGDLLEALLKTDKDGKMIAFLVRAVRNGVMDERRLLDYVDSRKEIDYRKIGAIGESMGSIMSSILG